MINTKCANCGTHHSRNSDFCSNRCEKDMTGFSSVQVNVESKKFESESKKASVDGGGMRFNSGKLPINLIPTSAMYALADVLEYGATKYDDHNWRRGMKWSVPYSCAMRHLLKWFEGEERDEESGREHLSHVMANIAMLVEFSKTCPELDDRFKGSQRRYDSFKSEDNQISQGLTEADLDDMAKEYDPETYCNGRS